MVDVARFGDAAAMDAFIRRLRDSGHNDEAAIARLLESGLKARGIGHD